MFINPWFSILFASAKYRDVFTIIKLEVWFNCCYWKAWSWMRYLKLCALVSKLLSASVWVLKECAVCGENHCLLYFAKKKLVNVITTDGGNKYTYSKEGLPFRAVFVKQKGVWCRGVWYFLDSSCSDLLPTEGCRHGELSRCLSSVSQRELMSELIWSVLILFSIRTFKHCLTYSNTVRLRAAFEKPLKTQFLHKKFIRPAANNVNYGHYGHREWLKCLSHVFQLITSGNQKFLVFLNQVLGYGGQEFHKIHVFGKWLQCGVRFKIEIKFKMSIYNVIMPCLS